MLIYLARRLLLMIPTLLVISVLIFAIIKLPPGDYLSNQIAELRAQGESSALERVEFLRKQYALDRPFFEQYAIWMGFWPGPNGLSGLLQGDWGWSFEYNRPVGELIGDRLAMTAIINFFAIVFIYVVAFPIGVYSATRQYSWGDYGFTLLGYIGLATPNFLLALVLLYYVNMWFGVSMGGLVDPDLIEAPWNWEKIKSLLSHMVVPVIVIGTSGTAAMIRRLRANLLDELQKQYVTTARANGRSPLAAVDPLPDPDGTESFHCRYRQSAAIRRIGLSHRFGGDEPAHGRTNAARRLTVARSVSGGIVSDVPGGPHRRRHADLRHPSGDAGSPHPPDRR
jgi:ABC-type dipeptide/oligopeptide/nickel transport systems, permease components